MKLSVIDKVVYVLNILSIFAILIAYLSNFISPKIFSFIQFFGLSFIFLVILNLLFVIYWILRKKWLFLYSLAVLLIGLNFINRVFNFSRKPEKVYINQISILSQNVRLFNLYKWLKSGFTWQSFLDISRQYKPEIICLQEYLESPKLRNVNVLEKLYTDYVFSYKSDSLKFGLAIFSKYRIVNYGKLVYNKEAFGLWADCVNGDFKFRVINIHLSSVRLDFKDYETLDSLNFENGKLKRILKKIATGYKHRYYQIKILTNFIDTTNLPIILAGDLNDTPISYTYHQIKNRLKDSFLEAGKGIGSTYTKYLPLRIDYVFISEEFSAIEFKKINKIISDHYPIFVKIAY